MGLIKILSFFASSESSSTSSPSENDGEKKEILKSRRDFLRSAMKPVRNTISVGKSFTSKETQHEPVVSIPRIWIRPPGAIEETLFRKKCDLCGECMTACPKSAIIVHQGSTDGTQFPYLNLHMQACAMCEDFPCIKSCNTGALNIYMGKKIGTARINDQLCNQFKENLECTYCRDYCPIPEIFMVEQNSISLNEEKCSGCGICLKVCPVDFAINIEPVA